jgi:hypothetical protein
MHQKPGAFFLSLLQEGLLIERAIIVADRAAED